MRSTFFPSTSLLLSWLTSLAVAGPIIPRDAAWPRDAPKCQKNDVYTKGVGFSRIDAYEKDGLCVTRWDEGVLPRKIYAEAGEDGLRKVVIEWTDGEKKVTFGNRNGDKGASGILEWSPFVDTWEYLGFNQDGFSGGIGRMVGKLKRRIEGDTTTLDAGGLNKKKIWWQPEIGKGILIGFKIRPGDVIDYMEPMFTQTAVQKMVLRNMKFSPTWEELNDWPFSKQQMQVLDIGHTYTNRVNASARLIIDASFNVRRSTEWNTAYSNMQENHYNVDIGPVKEVEAEVGIPFLNIGADVKAKGDLIKGGYKRMHMNNHGSGSRNVTSEQMVARARAYQTVPALSSVTCVTALVQSDVTLDFTGDMVWVFEDGKEHVYPVQGKFKNANYANAVTDCQQMDPKEYEEQFGFVPSNGVWNPPSQIVPEETGDNPNSEPLDNHGDDDGLVDDMRKRDQPSYLASDNTRVVYGKDPYDEGFEEEARGEDESFNKSPETSTTIEKRAPLNEDVPSSP